MSSSAHANRLPPRLTRKAEFSCVFRNGKRFRMDFVQMLILPLENPGTPENAGQTGRVGFVVPQHTVKLSTKRNRVKRMLREAIRHWWRYIDPPHDIVLNVFEFPKINHAAYVESVFIRLLLKSGIMNAEGEQSAKIRLNVLMQESGNRSNERKHC
jgi:ribonuclease P protein component